VWFSFCRRRLPPAKDALAQLNRPEAQACAFWNCAFCREAPFPCLNIKRLVPYESVRSAVGRVVLAKILDPVLTDWFGFHLSLPTPALPTLDNS
jgi:hypothetical protein